MINNDSGCETQNLLRERINQLQNMVKDRDDRIHSIITRLNSVRFPTAMRKMWSGGEVEQWWNEKKDFIQGN